MEPMPRRRKLLAGIASSAFLSALALACYGPTGLELRLDTDECARAGETIETGIFVGGERVDDDPRTTTNACEPASSPKIGTLVLVPDGERDAQVRVEVVLAINATAAECKANGFVLGTPGQPTVGPRRGCLVQRRRLGFRPHKTLGVSIALNQARCFNVACTEGTTCGRDGTCVSDDCRDGSCEEALPPASAPEPDGGLLDAAVLPDAAVPAPDLVYTGSEEITAGLHHLSDSLLVFGEGRGASARMITYDVAQAKAAVPVAVQNLVQVFASPEDPARRVTLAGVDPTYEVKVWSGISSTTANPPVAVAGSTPSLARAFGKFGVAFSVPVGGNPTWRTLDGSNPDSNLVGEPFAAAGDATRLVYLARGNGAGPSRQAYLFDPNASASKPLDLGGSVDAPLALAPTMVHATSNGAVVSAAFDTPGQVDTRTVGTTILALYAVGPDVYFVSDVAVGRVTPTPGAPPFVEPPPVILATRNVQRKTSFLTVTSDKVYWTEGSEIRAVAR